MKRFLQLLCVHCALCVSNSVFGAQPIVNAKISGSANELIAGATLTFNGTVNFSGATIVGLPGTSTRITNINGLVGGANKLFYFSGTDTFAQLSFSSLSQALLPLTTSAEWFDAVAPSSPSAGDIIQHNGTHWVKVSLGGMTGLLKLTAGVPSQATSGVGGDYVAPGAITSSGLTVSTGVLLGRTTSGTGATEPISPGDNLALSSGFLHSTALFRSHEAKTANYTVVSTDRGRLIDCVSGTFTIAFDPAATLSEGFFVAVYNSGSGTITLNPDSSETIRDPFSSATTKTLAQGEGVVLVCDGTGLLVIMQARSSSASGDVVGPSSATDNAVARYDSTTGKLLQNSLITIDDSGVISFPDGVRQTFNPNGTSAGLNVGSQAGDPASPSNGDLWYDSTANELNARVNGANVSLGTGSGDVVGPASSTDYALAIYNSTTGKLLRSLSNLTSDSGGNIFLTSASGNTPAIHLSSGSNYCQNYYNSGADTYIFQAVGSGFGSTKITFRNFQTSKELTMNANGTLLVNGYGAGTLTTDSSGNVTATSDARLKNIDGDFTRGLADLKKISPKRYHWKKDSGLDPENQYAGLIAQDVQAAIPEAIGTTPQGTLSLSDRPLIAALINAAKELDARNAALEYRVTILSILTIGLFVAIIVAAVLASLRARS